MVYGLELSEVCEVSWLEVCRVTCVAVGEVQHEGDSGVHLATESGDTN